MTTAVGTKTTFDEQTQLDEILNELLGDPFMKSSSAMTKPDASISPDMKQGSITTHSGNSRTVMSWQTSNAGPGNYSTTVSKETVSHPSQDTHTKTSSVQSQQVMSYGQPKSADKVSKLPPNAFSYESVQETKRVENRTESTLERVKSPTSMERVKSPSAWDRDRVTSPTFNQSVNAPPPPVRDRVASPTYRDRVGSPTFRDRVGSPTFREPGYNPKSPSGANLNHLPYKVDYEDAQRGYYSDSDPSMSWLQQQQVKLQNKRDGSPNPGGEWAYGGRTKQERQLMAEMKNAQSTLARKRAASQQDEDAVLEEYAKQQPGVFLQNGPLHGVGTPSPEPSPTKARSPEPLERHNSYKAEKKFFVSGIERPPFTTHQTKYTFSVSPPKLSNGSLKNKPPPSPCLGRSSAPNSPIIPARGQSSKEAVMRTRTTSVSSNKDWESHEFSPKLEELERSLQQAMQFESPQVKSSVNSDYESGRTDSSDSRMETSFESRNTFGSYDGRSMSPEWDSKKHAWSQHSPPVRETREIISLVPIGPGMYNLEPHKQIEQAERVQSQQSAPHAAPPEEETEEEVITLQPIGPGMQNLEPDVSRDLRSPTPSFPVQAPPVTPLPAPHGPPATSTPRHHAAPAPNLHQEPVTPRQQAVPTPSLIQDPEMERLLEAQMIQSTQSPVHETSPMVNKSGFQYSSSSSGTRSGQQYNTMPHHGGVPQETAVVPEQSLGVHATMPHRRVGSPPVHQQPVVESPVLALKRGGQQQQSSSSSSALYSEVHHPGGGQARTTQKQVVQTTQVNAQPGGAPQQDGVVRQQFVTQQQTVQRGYATSPQPVTHVQDDMQQRQQQQQHQQQQMQVSQQQQQSPEIQIPQQHQQKQQQQQYIVQQQSVQKSYSTRTQDFGDQHQPSVQQSGVQQTVQNVQHQQPGVQQPAGQQTVHGVQQPRASVQAHGDHVQAQKAQTVQSSNYNTTNSTQGYNTISGSEQSGYNTSNQGYNTLNNGHVGYNTISGSQGGFNTSGGGFNTSGGGYNTMSGGDSSQRGYNTISSSQSGYNTMGSSQQTQQYTTQTATHQTHQVTPGSQHQTHQVTPGSQHIMQNGDVTRGLSVDTSHHRSMSSGSSMPRSPSSAGSAYSPSSPGSLNMMRAQFSQASQSGTITPGSTSFTGQNSPSVYFGQSRRGSQTSLMDGVDVVSHTPRFVRDTSKYWYKPHISREDAIILLKDKQPGTFVVRDSNSFPGAFGLAVKVAQVPPNVQTKGGDPQAELVRHFLIEPTPKGVKLKGCSNEPVFGSLAALVYQHSITTLALPCKLNLAQLESAEVDTIDGKVDSPSTASQLLHQGAACNVLYLNSMDMESLTGPEAVSKAIKDSLLNVPKTTVVHFKVSSQGITLTDSKRKLFFRRHYPVGAVTYCGMDSEDRRWNKTTEAPLPPNAKLFGFVARKTGSTTDNACHIFAEMDPDQPATAIVNFVTKVMIGQGKAVKLQS